MPNPTGVSLQLIDIAGPIATSGLNKIFCVGIKTALTGSLTISGLTTGNATPNIPVDWVLGPGSVGVYTHPGNGNAGGGALNYALSSAADSGKAFVMFTNTL